MRLPWLAGAGTAALFSLSIANMLNTPQALPQVNNEEAGKIVIQYHQPYKVQAHLIGFAGLAASLWMLNQGLQKQEEDEEGNLLSQPELAFINEIKDIKDQEEQIEKRKNRLNEIAKQLGYVETPISKDTTKGLTSREKRLPKAKSLKSKEEEGLSKKHQWVKGVAGLPFKVIAGVPGSGKSTMLRFFIQQTKALGNHVIVINPGTAKSVWKGVEVLTGAEEINEFFANFPEMVQKRIDEANEKVIDPDNYLNFIDSEKRKGREGRVSIFLMESNTYRNRNIDLKSFASAFGYFLTDIRKWGFTACFEAQSDNITSICKELEGYSKLFDQQPRIEPIPDMSTGVAKSSGYAELKIEGAKQKEGAQRVQFPHVKTKDFRTEEEKCQGLEEEMLNDPWKAA